MTIHRLVLVLAIPLALSAESPVVDHVCCALAPGSLAEVEGYCFDRTATVQVGGLPAPVLGYQEFYNSGYCGQKGLWIQLPVELAPGPTTLVITSGGVSSAPVSITLDAYAPAFLPAGIWVGTLFRVAAFAIFIDRALPTGGFAPSSCWTDQKLKAGDLVRAYTFGLGPSDPLVPTGVVAPAMPLAKTSVKPSIAIEGKAAAVIESVLAPGLIGVYRVTFEVPMLSEDVYKSIKIGIGEKIHDAMWRADIVATGPAYRAAPESIQTASACVSVAGQTVSQITGDPKNPPTTLGGFTVWVKDSQGVERQAALLSVVSNRVDYLVPAGTANGLAKVTVNSGDGAASTEVLDIQSVAPRPLTPSPPAVAVVRVRAGVQTVEPAFEVIAAGGYQPVPIDLGAETDEVYLVVFGTGWRFRSPPSASAGIFFETVSGANIVASLPADYAGPQGEFAGVDQMNVRLPRSLIGRGDVFGYLEVDGKRSALFARLSFK